MIFYYFLCFNTGKEIGIVFKTASPFDTPILMKQLVDETNALFDSKLYPPLDNHCAVHCPFSSHSSFPGWKWKVIEIVNKLPAHQVWIQLYPVLFTRKADRRKQELILQGIKKYTA